MSISTQYSELLLSSWSVHVIVSMEYCIQWRMNIFLLSDDHPNTEKKNRF